MLRTLADIATIVLQPVIDACVDLSWQAMEVFEGITEIQACTDVGKPMHSSKQQHRRGQE